MAQSPTAREFLASIESAAHATREDVPGWVVRRPLLSDVADHLDFVSADSKPEDDTPFFLPLDTESCVCVVEGSVSIADREIQQGSLVTVHAHDAREITSLVHPSRIFCIFLKAADDDERAMGTR